MEENNNNEQAIEVQKVEDVEENETLNSEQKINN